MPSCPYKDLFGKVGEGAHSYRIFNIAIVDVTLTVLAAYLFHRFVFPKSMFWVVLLALFLAGILLHHLFCVQTTIDKFLFG
jgi:hypothetical protein